MNELISKIKEMSEALLMDATTQAERVTRLPVLVHVRHLWNWKNF